MNKLMCHVVAGFPSVAECLELMVGMQAAGVVAIEVQIPFSDPIADGETIMAANDGALEGGMTTAGSFELIQKAQAQGVVCDIYVMSYVQKVRHFGLTEFCQQAAEGGVKGLIIPDLPYDSPEFVELQQLAEQHHLQLVPVLSPGMAAERLQAILALQPTVLYITSTRGITGNDFAPAAQLQQLTARIKQHSQAQLLIGFGISTMADVTDALAVGDVAVVGSAVIKQVQNDDVAAGLDLVRSLVGES